MIHFHNLTLGYERHPVIHHLHGEVATGSLLAIVGPNGGGKSTLLKGILGQLAPLGGEIRLAVDRQEIGYLPQQSRIDRQFPITVREVVAMGLWRHCGLFGRLAHSQRARVAAVLERVGLDNMAEARLEALSGGQLQRALFARLWLQESRLMLLDEPFSAIDSQTTEDLLALLREWQQGQAGTQCGHQLGNGIRAEQAGRATAHEHAVNGAAPNQGQGGFQVCQQGLQILFFGQGQALVGALQPV